MCGSSTARRRSSDCWNGFIRRSRPRRCTGSYTAIRPKHGPRWTYSGSATTDVRPHWALIPPDGTDPLTPADVYVRGRTVQLPKRQGWAKTAKEKLKKMTEGGIGHRAWRLRLKRLPDTG